ncbi:hypothetical protein CK489_36770 [Bradyrhizobium sp. UFLA03-84]|nr:hypothetical protein CK489_36770 [Bradyrhizobium sp. UFLA03-84]
MAAADNLKGTYYLVGAQTCLVAPAGFKQDSNGNLTIPIGETNLSQLTTEGRIIYHGDGTGEAKQTFVTIVPPTPNSFGAAVSAGAMSYSFTYEQEGDNAYRMTVKPGTFKGELNAGPNAGKQFSIEGDSRLFRVSDDGKRIAAAMDKPFVQKISFSGSPQPVPRVCTSISNQSMINGSTVTEGRSR